MRWVYLDGGSTRGTVIELLERTPRSEALFGSALGLLREMEVTRRRSALRAWWHRSFAGIRCEPFWALP